MKHARAFLLSLLCLVPFANAAAQCEAVDLKGVWEFYFMVSIGWFSAPARTTLDLDAAGNIRTAAPLLGPDGENSGVSITAGKLAIDQSCIVSGQLLTTNMAAITGAINVKHATMDEGKTIIAGIAVDPPGVFQRGVGYFTAARR